VAIFFGRKEKNTHERSKGMISLSGRS